MERITNVRISSLSKAVSGMSDIYVESVYLSGGSIYVKDIEGNIYDLAKMGCGCSTPRANVIATLLRGVDGKDGKDGKTQDLSEYYKKSEVDGKLKQKQDTISDLDTIRANAEKGATALQSVPDEYITESKLSSKGYATSREVTGGLSNKVDKEAGKGLSTEDFTTLLKQKLLSLQNYDDASIREAVGNITDLVNNFNADIANLYATKQDVIADLDAIRRGAGKGDTSVQGVVVNNNHLIPDGRGTIFFPKIPAETDIANMGFTKNKGTVTEIMVNGEAKSPNSNGIVDLGNIEGGGGNVSFIDNDSLKGLPFGYIDGYYRSYEFDGVSTEEVNLGYINNYYYNTIAIAYNDKLYEERIRNLMGDGKLLGTVVVRVDDGYNLYAKQVSLKKTTFGWRIYTGKQLMPDSWVDLENYYTKEEVDEIKQDKLTLTVKDNGNIVIGGIAGQSKEFMPATPSGDPMHDVYLSYYGVRYDDATGLYSLGYLNNLTVEDMRKAFRTYGGGVMSIAYNSWINSWWLYNTIKGELPRTTLPSHTNGARFLYDKIHFSFAWNALEQIYIGLRPNDQYGMIKVWQLNTAETMFVFSGMENLKYIVDTLHCNYTHNLTIFNTLTKLEEVRLYGLGGNVSFGAAKNLSLESILYAINNCASGVLFTMTFHPDVYNKCIVGGEWYSEVKSALDSAATDKNTIITIASA